MPRDILFEPFRIGAITLRNRIVSTAHEPAYTENGMPKDRYRLYHLEKARGGIGMTMIGGSAVVSADSPGPFGNIDISTDEVVPWLRRLSDDVHAEGAAVMIQLTHLGYRASNSVADWLPLLAPSRQKEPAHRSFAKAMERFDIDRVVSDFGAAARRAAEGGLDGVEIMHDGHLLDMFMTPRLNQRDDEYSADAENRMRLLLRVIDSVREAVPDDFVIGLKASVEMREDGIDEDLLVEIINTAQEHGVQLLNLVTGTIESDDALSKQIPGMGTPSAPHLELCRRVRQRIAVPLLHATRISDIATARYAVTEGCLDLVGMVRPQIADPYLPKKAMEGAEDDIRPCVGANLCLDSIYNTGSSVCIHNPATGREGRLPQSIPRASESGRRRVVIIGAGPAGLEAARVSAFRGHEVIVLEANATYGGQVRIAAHSERRRDLIGIVDWRYQQALKHGAQFIFDSYADADEVLARHPDIVIVATGGVPDTELFRASVPINDVWDVMQDGLSGKQRVLVYDDFGQSSALDAVERLSRNGQEVVYVTPERKIGIDVGEMNAPAYLRAFSEGGVQTLLNERVISAERSSAGCIEVALRNEYSGATSSILVDAIVVEHGTIPNDELYFDMKGLSKNLGEVDYTAFVEGGSQEDVAGNNADGAFEIFRIGDAVVSRNVHAAILDGLRLGLGA